jgi:hypothetical protein
VVVPFVAVPDARTVVALLVVAVLVGAELVVDARTSVPVALGMAVVAAAFTVSASHALFAGLLVGATATASSWWCTRAGGRARTISAVALAAIGGAAAGAVVGEVDGLTVPAVLGAVAAVAVFAAVALVLQDPGWRTREAMVPVWAAPIVAMVVGTGIAVATWREALPLPVLALALGAVALVWCGAPPWRSRVLSPRLGSLGGRGRRAVLGGLAAVAAACAVVAVVVGSGAAHPWVIGATVAAGTAAAMTAGAVRQWRFAPRARARDVAVLVGAAVLVAVYPVATAGGSWWSPVPLCVAVAGVLLVGRAPVARSDAARPSPAAPAGASEAEPEREHRV